MSGDDRCINVPSWSLPISMIIEVATEADERGVSQSSIVREALDKYLNPIQEDEEMVQYDKKIE